MAVIISWSRNQSPLIEISSSQRRGTRGKICVFEWCQTNITFSPPPPPSSWYLSLLRCADLCVFDMLLPSLPEGPPPPSGTTSSGKPFLTPQCNADAPWCPQNHLCILVTNYIIAMAYFLVSAPLRTWTKTYLILNCNRHSVMGMNENKQKKKWKIREVGSYWEQNLPWQLAQSLFTSKPYKYFQ